MPKKRITKILTQLLKYFSYYVSSFSNSLNLNLNKFSKILAIKMTVFEFLSTYFKQNFNIIPQNKNWMSEPLLQQYNIFVSFLFRFAQ